MADTKPAIQTQLVRSTAWRLTEVVAGEGLAFAVFLVLARFLTAEAFGLVALAGVVIHFARYALGAGLPDAYIVLAGRLKRPGAEQALYSSLVWTNLAAGAAGAAVLLILALPLERVMQSPGLAFVLSSLAPTLPLSALVSALGARLRRNMQFRAFAIRSILGVAAGGCLGLTLAWYGYGVEALVAQQWGNLVVSLLVFGWAAWAMPSPRLDGARRLWRMGWQAGAGSLLQLLARRLDLLVVGFFVPVAAVGHYFFAQRLVQALDMVLTMTVQQLGLPALAKATAVPAQLERATLSALKWSSLCSVGPTLCLALLAPSLIQLFVGAKWEPAAPILAVLAVGALARPLCMASNQALLAAHKAPVALSLNGQTACLYFLGVLAAAPFGVEGAALGGAVGTALGLPLWLAALHRHLGIARLSLLRSQLPAVAAGCALVLAVELAQALLAFQPLWLWLLMALLLGLGAYALTLLLCVPELRRIWSRSYGTASPSASDRATAPTIRI